MDKKALNLPILTSLVVGNMIGTGIYVLPASLAPYGTMSLLAWIYTSIGSIFLAITLAHLNKRFPKTGGPYIFCREAFGRLVGFIIGYTYWFSVMASIAGIAVASVGYLGFISPTLNANSPEYNSYYALGLDLLIVWIFTLINIIGIHAAGVVQLILTILKIAPLILIVLVGLPHVHLDYFTQVTLTDQTYFGALGSAAALTFWAFVGLESATLPAENTKGPKDIYKATVFGTIITAVIYISSTFVLMGMIPNAQLKVSQFPFAEAGAMLFGQKAALIVVICAIISGLGALNGCVLTQAQIVFAAARDHLFPKAFKKLSKHDVPVAGQLLSSTLISLLLIMTVEPTMLKQFNNIALLTALLTLITYLACTFAELKFLLQSRTSLFHIFYSKSFLIVILASAYSIWTISSIEKAIIRVTFILLLLLIPVYFIAFRKIPKSN